MVEKVNFFDESFDTVFEMFGSFTYIRISIKYELID